MSRGSSHGTNRHESDTAAQRYSSPEWQAWFARHLDHHSTGSAIAHPMGCNRSCLDDAPDQDRAAAPRRRKWSKYDAAHGARIRMILDGPDKGSWVAWCLDCDWTMDDPVPPFVAGEAAKEHEREADHAAA